MGKVLSAAAIDQYRRDGYYAPVRVVFREQAGWYRERLESVERDLGGPLRGVYRIKPHLLFTWLAELVRHGAILDAVEDVIGPDILCWNSSFFTKEAESPGYVSWHQDATYWGLSEPDVVTAWVAFTESTLRNGNMQVIPGSHLSQAAHVDTFHPDNLLSRGQEIAVEVDEAQAADIVLEPGEMSLHHVLIVHGSRPNTSSDRRIGYAIRYIPTRVRQLAGPRDSATLVRGRDAYGHFDPEPAPAADLDPEALALHADISDRQVKILYRGTTRTSF
jgi:non-haem Fe2+, alpha-ketoglutarate-dependent halogenase